MYNLETVESLHAYADRLHRERTRVASTSSRRSAVRSLVRRARRTA